MPRREPCRTPQLRPAENGSADLRQAALCVPVSHGVHYVDEVTYPVDEVVTLNTAVIVDISSTVY